MNELFKTEKQLKGNNQLCSSVNIGGVAVKLQSSLHWELYYEKLFRVPFHRSAHYPKCAAVDTITVNERKSAVILLGHFCAKWSHRLLQFITRRIASPHLFLYYEKSNCTFCRFYSRTGGNEPMHYAMHRPILLRD